MIEGEVIAGHGNFIGHGAIIGAPPQDVSFSPERKTRVEIGNDNITSASTARSTAAAPTAARQKSADRNFLMAGAHIGHNCIIGNEVIIANNCLLAGHVRVDNGAFLGGGSTFHQFMHIGRLVMVQGSSALGRICLRSSSQRSATCRFWIKHRWTASRWIECKGPGRNQGGIQTCLPVRTEHWTGPRKGGNDDIWRGAERLDFVANSKKRGICPLKRGIEDDLSV